MICPKCQKEHNKDRFYCSRSCANSRTFSEVSCKKKSIANKLYASKHKQIKTSYSRLKQKQTLYDKGLKLFLEGKCKDTGICKKWLKRTRVEECEICKLKPEWQGKFLSLHIDHKDGDRNNNNPSNLRLLCPNCHSQTETYSGKKHRKPNYASSEAAGLSNQ